VAINRLLLSDGYMKHKIFIAAALSIIDCFKMFSYVIGLTNLGSSSLLFIFCVVDGRRADVDFLVVAKLIGVFKKFIQRKS
jgi:hypothetical protein